MKGLFKYCFAILALCAISNADVKAQATDSHVKASLKLLDLGNARQAVSDLQQLVQNEPKNAEAHAGLAIAQLEMNNLTAATSEAAAAYELDRRNSLVHIARATLYGRQGNTADALKEYATAIKQNDKEPGNYLALARYYLQLDSLKAAEITLYRAQQINDKDVRSYLGLAELYERQRIPDLAIGQYEQARKLDPNDVTVMAHLAGMYFRARKYNESVNEWIKILRVDSTYADAYYQVGNLYFLGSQYQNAAAYAKRYTELKPDDIYGQWLLARALTEINQYSEAVPALQKVASNDSLRALSQLLLARGYFYAKEYPKALEVFRAAKNMGPNDYNYYGLALVITGDTAGGIQQIRQSLVNDTVRSAQQKLDAQVLIARLLYSQKKIKESADAFAEVANANPTADWYLTAGQMYSFAKDPATAQSFYQKALAIDPNSVKVNFQIAQDMLSDYTSEGALTAFQRLEQVATAKGANDTLGLAEGFIGYSYLAKKDWAKATSYLAKATSLLENSTSLYKANFYSTLGQAYLQTKEYPKAKDAFEKALKLEPTNKPAKDGLEFLKQTEKASSKK